MGGAPGGLTGTGTVNIKVLDINDNIPTLEKSEVRNTVYSTHTYTHMAVRVQQTDSDMMCNINQSCLFSLFSSFLSHCISSC